MIARSRQCRRQRAICWELRATAAASHGNGVVDDHTIVVNGSPRCEVPNGVPAAAIARLHVPIAMQVSEPVDVALLLAAA